MVSGNVHFRDVALILDHETHISRIVKMVTASGELAVSANSLSRHIWDESLILHHQHTTIRYQQYFIFLLLPTPLSHR